MLKYIVDDFEQSRMTHSDSTIGGMVICESSEQARQMYEIFNHNYASNATEAETSDLLVVAEPTLRYAESFTHSLLEEGKVKTAALILHDAGTKAEREKSVEDFKAGKIDFLFVYNMLITGFDAPRLKKLYLGRIIKKHNLLQALTRVNRTYKDFSYGYVVDFADISKEFDATNKAYFDELQSELGDEMEHYSNLFKSTEEIEQEIAHIKDILFRYDIENAENFSTQISQIQDPKIVQGIKKVLEDAKSLYNLIRLFGHYELLEKLDFRKLNMLYTEVSNHLNLLNIKANVENSSDTTNLLNVALEDIVFMFTKIGQEELVLADKLKNILRKTREALASNFDPKDPEFVTLKQELERLFKSKNLSEISQEEMIKNIDTLKEIYEKTKELNRQNDLLKSKYQNDTKYARVHKRIAEQTQLNIPQARVCEALQAIKNNADEQILQNSKILTNESYFEKMTLKLVVEQFNNKQQINLNAENSKYINRLVVNEYMKEYLNKSHDSHNDHGDVA